MKTETRFLSPARVSECIFCEGNPLTAEHLFSNWLRNIVPRDEDSWSGGTLYGSEPSFRGKRDLFSVKYRVVCGACNGGWMSEIEAAAKPVLAPLILNQRIEMGPSEIQKLASWITLKTMISEYADSYGRAIPQEERTFFWKHKLAMSNWKIWIGTYHLPNGRLRRRIATYLFVDDPRQPRPTATEPNAQFTTLNIGHLLIHAFSSEPPFTYEVGLPQYLKALHSESKIHFPGDHLISDELRFQISESAAAFGV
jgi:hypothetical protein